MLSNIKESLAEKILPINWQHFYILRDPRQIYVHRFETYIMFFGHSFSRVIKNGEKSDDVLKELQHHCLLLKSNKESLNQYVHALIYEDFIDDPFNFLVDLFSKMGIIFPYALLDKSNSLGLSGNDWIDQIDDQSRRKIESFCPWGLREWGFQKRVPLLPTL